MLQRKLSQRLFVWTACQQRLGHGHGQDRVVCPCRTLAEQREIHRLDGVKLVHRTDDVACHCSQHCIPPEIGAAYQAPLCYISILPIAALRDKPGTRLTSMLNESMWHLRNFFNKGTIVP